MADKRYDQFAAQTPAATDITLFANPTTGELKKTTLAGLSGGILASFDTDSSNVGSGETDLYNYALPANTLINDGDALRIKYGLTYNGLSATNQVKFYIEVNNSTLVADFNGGGDFILEILFVKKSATVGRLILLQTTPVTPPTVSNAEYTVMDFTVDNEIKITATSTVSDDITAKIGIIELVKFIG